MQVASSMLNAYGYGLAGISSCSGAVGQKKGVAATSVTVNEPSSTAAPGSQPSSGEFPPQNPRIAQFSAILTGIWGITRFTIRIGDAPVLCQAPAPRQHPRGPRAPPRQRPAARGLAVHRPFQSRHALWFKSTGSPTGCDVACTEVCKAAGIPTNVLLSACTQVKYRRHYHNASHSQSCVLQAAWPACGARHRPKRKRLSRRRCTGGLQTPTTRCAWPRR